MMASNADWVVPATDDERRYFVLDVSDSRRGDTAYFAALHQAIEGAELPAFMDYLQQLDPSGFDHRNPPHTAALNRQKLASGDSVTKFWLDCLRIGEIVGTGVDGWPVNVVIQVLHAAYVDHAHDHGERHPLADQQFSNKLAEMMPGGKLRSIRPREPYGEVKRPTRYKLPALDDCRAAFLQAMKIDDHDWPEIEDE
jgi:hypothetical protein